jgi:hypothetical protein
MLTEEGSSPNWASKKFEVFLWFLDGSSQIEKGTSGVEFLLPLMFLVGARVLWLNVRMWMVKDQIQPLEDPHGSTHTLLGEV